MFYLDLVSKAILYNYFGGRVGQWGSCRHHRQI